MNMARENEEASRDIPYLELWYESSTTELARGQTGSFVIPTLQHEARV